ncbi:MAG: Transcriptional regulator, TrmB [Candidatus Moranbacteria bacterium GW2011_GWE1_49_15]|nr:MAG: Transcriptional regulator, TrmB [Candidatus Moranbacteria bacterium GW2011_GWE2_47_10]KKW07239.1 MAG: Transcriptional regulator, TrmB [Candidatus Moranbacteria bacterium GW2011_GWE1_49_15]HBP01573.1 hypothetical protein [Candidatus Moranbacteria bacterium]
MDKDLIKLLENSGFTEKEAQVYLALLELSQGTVTQISKLTGLKRPIIYVVLEGLIKRGYVSEIPERKINTYHSMDPSVILKKLQSGAKNFAEMLPILRTLGSKGKKRPKIVYHDTREGIWNIYEDIVGVDDAFFVSSYHRIDRHFPGAVDFWIDGLKKMKLDLKARHLMADIPEERKIAQKIVQVKGQHVRVLNDIKDISIDFTFYKNRIAITSLGEEPFMVVIESDEVVKSLKPIFEIAWEKGTEIRKDKDDRDKNPSPEIPKGRTRLA